MPVHHLELSLSPATIYLITVLFGNLIQAICCMKLEWRMGHPAPTHIIILAVYMQISDQTPVKNKKRDSRQATLVMYR